MTYSYEHLMDIFTDTLTTFDKEITQYRLMINEIEDTEYWGNNNEIKKLIALKSIIEELAQAQGKIHKSIHEYWAENL